MTYASTFASRLARGTEPTVDIAQTKVEATFYDQSFSARGTLIPLKILPPRCNPDRHGLPAANRRYLSTTRCRGVIYANESNSLEAIIASAVMWFALFYRGQLQDAYAQPADLRSVCPRRACLS